MFKDYDEMISLARKYSPKKVAVAGAEEDTVIQAVKEAENAGLIEALLIGNKDSIINQARLQDYKFNNDRIIHITEPDKMAETAVKMASADQVDIVMKGMIQTSTLMKAVLDKSFGLRTEKLISHLFMIKLPLYHKFLSLTDGGINISPNLEEKKAILENCIWFYHLMGMEKPKIALLAPVETVSEKIPSTIDAAILSKMTERDQIKGAIIDGPLAFDNAISLDSVREKGLDTPVGGDADVLFVSNIDMGNGLFKGLVYFGKGIPAAVMLGTKKPVIITSRADSGQCKFLSIALNVLLAGRMSEIK